MGGKAQRTGLWEEDGDGDFITKNFLININNNKRQRDIVSFFPVTSHQILLGRAKA